MNSIHLTALTHCEEVIKDFVHADKLIVQLIICGRVGKKGIPICDEEVEYLGNLGLKRRAKGERERGREGEREGRER